MLKILRKNKQWLFVGFMGLLAVAWLVPSLGKGATPADQAKETVGMIGDTKLKLGELNLAEQEFEALKQMYKDIIPLETLLGIKVENGSHWLLLTREAQQAGLIGGPTDGADWTGSLAHSLAVSESQALLQREPMRAYQLLQQDPQAKEFLSKNLQAFFNNPQSFAPLLSGMMEPRLLNVLTQLQAQGNSRLAGVESMGAKIAPDVFDQTMAKVRGVRRLTNAFFGAARTSDKRLASLVTERLDMGIVNLVQIPAARLKNEIPDPTPEQLKEHFDKYKAVPPGTGELGISYVQPDGLKLEYLKLDRTAIEAAIKPDEVEVNKRWRTNRAVYKGEFTEERPKIEASMKAELVKAAMAEAVRIARGEIARAMKKLPDDGAYKQLPADWETSRIKLQDVARAIQTTLKQTQGTDIAEPLVTLKTGNWVSPKEVSELEGISRASVQMGPRRESFLDVLSHLRELGSRNDYALQIGVPYPTDKALEGEDGSLYFFVVTALKKSAPAESVDEVKTQAIDDYKLLAAFEKLKAEKQKYLDKAAAEGLDALAQSFERPPLDAKTGEGGEKALEVQKLVQMNQSRVVIGGREDRSLADKVFLEQVRAIVKSIDPKAEPILGDAARGDAVKNRFVATHITPNKSLVIAFIVANRPITAEQMRAIGQGGEERVLVRQEFKPEEGQTSLADPFVFATMKQRMRYKLTREMKTEEVKLPEAASPPATGSGAGSAAPTIPANSTK